MNSHLLPLSISYRSSGEKLIKYSSNSSCVIMSVILMTTLFYKASIVQGEIWCWSLLGLKGLTSLKRPFKSEWSTNWYIPVPSSLCLVNFIFYCFCLINLYRLICSLKNYKFSTLFQKKVLVSKATRSWLAFLQWPLISVTKMAVVEWFDGIIWFTI